MSQSIDRYTDDPSGWRLKLSRDLVFWPDRSAGQISYRIEAPSHNKFFDIGYEEYVFISLLDGNTPTAVACGRCAQALGREALTQNQANQLIRWLLSNRLATIVNGQPSAAVEAAKDSKPLNQKLLGALNPFWMKMPLIRSSKPLESITPTLSWMFSKPIAIVAAMIIAIGLANISLNYDRFIQASEQIITSGDWVWTLLIWILLKIVHELSHAAACHRYGCETREFGIVMVLFAPLAYVDATSSLRLRSRWKRIVIAMAGMYIELTLAGIAAIVWSWTSSVWLSHLMFDLIVAASVSTLLFNANPLMKFDGYFILSDLLDIPNLQTEGSQAVNRKFATLFYGQDSNRGHWSGFRRYFVVGFGFAALIWRFAICLSLAIAAAYLFKGAGLALLGFGIFVWIVRPGLQIFRSLKETLNANPPAGTRAILMITCIVLISSAGLFSIPIATSTRAPAVIDFADGSRVRSAADGFIVEIHIGEGQLVQQGQPLFRLSNPELQQKLVDLKTKIQQSEVRQRIAADERDTAGVQIEKETYSGLAEQLSQVQEQADSLIVIAHRSGHVVASQLPEMMMTYVREGDELMAIAEETDKEVVVSIAQKDIHGAVELIGKNIDFLTASQQSAAGKLSRIEPIATRHIPHPAMAASNAGQLAVRQPQNSEEQSEYELLEPRFRAVIQLEPEVSRRLAAGQRARVFLGKERLTLYQRSRIYLDRLLRDARNQARLASR